MATYGPDASLQICIGLTLLIVEMQSLSAVSGSRLACSSTTILSTSQYASLVINM